MGRVSFSSSLNPDGDGPRAVVDQAGLPVGAELAAGALAGLAAGGGAGGGEGGGVLEEPPAPRGAGRAAEAGAVAAGHVGRQGELRDDQQAAAHVLQAQVHLAGRITEDAQLEHLGDQLLGLGLAVRVLGADQQQQAVLDGAYRGAGHVDLGPANSLQQCDHGDTSLGSSKWASTSVGSNWMLARRPGTA